MRRNLINKDNLLAWKAIDELNWKSIVVEVADVFFEAGKLQMQTLTTARKTKDVEGIRRAAHSLKSSCGNVGAFEAQAQFNKIELACQSSNADAVFTLMVDIDVLFADSCTQLAEFIKELHAT